MGLILDDGGTKLRFSVDSIGNNNVDDYSKLDYWMVISVSVNNKFFNYRYRGETLQYADLISIRNTLNTLLENRLKQKEKLDFIEPDLEFMLYPQLDLRTIPGTWCKEGYEIQDISVDFKINLPDNERGYSGEYHVVPLLRDEIVIWRDYLDQAIKDFDARNIENARIGWTRR